MKYTNNFAEVAKVFEAIAKVEEKASKFNAAAKEHEEASIAAYNKDLRSPEVMRMCDTFDVKEKAEKAYLKAAKNAVAVLELNKDDYEDAAVIENSRKSYKNTQFVYGLKWLAAKMAQRINVYESV